MQPKLPLSLGSRYRIVAEIASGGMGTIVLALRLEPDGSKRPVAIKQLHAHLAADPEIVASFLDEARIASRIIHPNVVRVQDVEMIGDELVIVMDYVEGVSLSVLLKTLKTSQSSLPLPVVRRVLHDALLGIHAAHELRDPSGAPLNVVHRDVSPHNILIAADGFTRVTDFGIATATGRVASTRTGGGVKGKLQYLSPEQIYRKPVDRRTDVFAAGTVLWECLTGKRLFSAATEGETLAMVLREPIAPPSTHRPDVLLELDEVCLRALERDPDRRYATAEEAANALAQTGELASRDEVGALVARVAPSTIASRRQVLEQAIRSVHFTPGVSVQASDPVSVDTGTTAAIDRAPTASSPSRLPLILALLVGLVAGGVGVGIAARRPSAPVAAAAPPTASSVAIAPPIASSVPSVSATSTASAQTSATTRATPIATPTSTAAARAVTSARATPKKPPSAGRPFMPNDL